MKKPTRKNIAFFGWRRLASPLTMLTGTILTFLVTYGGYSFVLREYQKQFDYDAQSRSTLIHDYLLERLGDLDSLHRFIEETASLNRPAFHEFVKPFVDRQGIQAMEWIPAVPDVRRIRAENAAIRDGLSEFHFKEKSNNGKDTTSARRDVYYPVYYVEPQKGNEKALGFDLGSNPARLEAIRQAVATGRPYATAPLKLVQERGSQTGFLVFVPVKATIAKEQGFALGVFRVGDMLSAALGPTAGKQIEEYEQQLRKSHEELRTTREEMQTTHEELKSANEELQSTNEELTTSKEEMQSMNEELQSVNAEQSTRLEDYIRSNNDMENLLNSTEIVTVFLDNHLKVRRYTTGANRLFKLIPGEVGRPLTDIVSDLNYPQLFDNVQGVLRKLISVENLVLTQDERSFMVRIMPYRTMDNVIDGVVITCIDITAAKKIEHELQDKIAKLEAQLVG